MNRTVLDVTRLLTRAGHAVATGVDRVELAYARRVLALPAERSGFAAIVGTRSVPLERDAVSAFVAALERNWSAGRGDDATALRLTQRLGAEPLAASAATPAEGSDAGRLALKLRAAAMLALSRTSAGSGDTYVHVSHIRLDRPKVFAGVRATGAKLAVLIHDLIPIRFPEYGRAGEAKRHGLRMGTALDHATTLIANSAETARDLAAFAAETGRTPPKILAAPLGIEAGFGRDGAAVRAQKPYFVAVGTIEPRKNHLLLLHLWRRLVDRLGEATPTLVLVGRRGWENEQVIDLLERAPAIRTHVVEVNDLADAALGALLRGARALLFPSFAEGYGLPLAEALALGAPTIASDLPAFREIVGDRVELLDPLDGMAWERAVLDYMADPSPRRTAAVERARGYAAPTWDAHFTAVDAAIGADG